MEVSKYIGVTYGGKGLAGYFVVGKMYRILVFISGFTHFLWVNFFVIYYACVNFVTFRRSEFATKQLEFAI